MALRIVPRRETLFFSIRAEGGGRELPRRRPWRRLLGCRHGEAATAVVTDHRPGPGWMSDSHRVKVCSGCGKVLQSRQIY